MPLKSIRFMTAVRSFPFSVSVDVPPGVGELIWWCVITPSISTSGVPLVVTTITTRTIGGITPPDRRKSVCSGEFLLSENVSSNPLVVSPAVVTTCTPVSASSTSRDTGIGTAGPIINVS